MGNCTSSSTLLKEIDHSQRNKQCFVRNIQRPKAEEEFHSEIYLKANLYLKMPKTIAKPTSAEESKGQEQTTITFFVWYAGQDFTWTEKCSADMYKS